MDKHTKLFFIRWNNCNEQALCHWETLLKCFVFSSEPGTELTYCAQSYWPLKNKCSALRGPNLFRTKEFSDCYISKTYSWKRATSFKAASEISEIHFPSIFSSRRWSLLLRSFGGKKKNKCNFALGSLNYLHVTSESTFRVSQ